MKKINLAPGVDPVEYQTLFDQLRLHAANLRGLLAVKESENLSPPTYLKDGESLFENLELVTNHITELEHRIGSGCPQFSPANVGGGTRSAVFPGGSSGAFTPGASSPSVKKQTLTDKVLKIRGVRTLDELNAMPPRDIGD